MPEGFTGIDPGVPNEVMLPFAARELTNPGPFDPDRWGSCSLIARLDPSVPVERARLAAEALVFGFVQAHPPRESYELPRLWMTDVSRGTDSLRMTTSRPLVILFSMVMATLLIACANVAGLIVACGEARRREVATRLAVGASRRRIVRQLLTESLILCAIGGALGTALVYGLSPFLPDLLREIAEIPSGGAPSRNAVLGVDTSPDLRVLVFAIATMTLTALVFGLAPAVRSARIRLKRPWSRRCGA